MVEVVVNGVAAGVEEGEDLVDVELLEAALEMFFEYMKPSRKVLFQ